MKEIINIGVNDYDIDLFEGQYVVPDGMAYNSYVVKGEKVAVTDSVDGRFVSVWLDNMEKAGVKPDYLVIHHMEPDHSAGIKAFAEKYPDAKLVGNSKTFVLLGEFFGTDFSDRQVVVKDGDVLDLGGRTLKFFTAPMVHWPEVMMSFDEKAGTLFSADAFGRFGALTANDDWACEARRYYFGIVGKFGAQVQAVLKKLSALPIKAICPLHGPVLSENLPYYLGLYNTWSSYAAEAKGVTIAYTSVYGHTADAVRMLEKELTAAGVKVALFDLARCDMAEAMEDAFKYDRLVLATTTYCGNIFPFMQTFINALVEHGYRNRKVGFIENGSWAPVAAKIMRGMLEGCKDLTFVGVATLHSAINDETKAQIKALANEMKE